MSDSPLSDVVSSQYSKWMYPEPIRDLPGWLTGNWQWFDPSHAHRMFWPDRGYRQDLRILVAGCGTNQGAVFASTNPRAHIVAIDVSQPSLDHHRVLKEKYSLRNLDLHRLPIEEAGTLDHDFDLIVSTGVLHHLADPIVGAKALAALLRPDGVLALMLYARHGRIGVEMMQGVFRDLGLEQNEASVLLVKEALAALGPDHPLRSYMALAPDLAFDAGLVDTFLHGRDRSYTTNDCRDLVASTGLVFQEWFLKSAYYPPAAPGNPFFAAVGALPEEKQWSVMERINARNACHFFTACRADRPPETWRIDFSSPSAVGYVPAFRHRCGLDGPEIFRHDWRLRLDPVQLALVQLVDGRRTIREIVATAATNGALPHRVPAELEALGSDVFASLWRRDFLAMCLGPAATADDRPIFLSATQRSSEASDNGTPAAAPPHKPATASRPKICLNMIVRNESHIIHELIEVVAPRIDYWVIVDTGSDDDTQGIIRRLMAERGIPGELHERTWRDFGHNRSEALALAQGHGDYIWVMDADDTIAGTVDFSGVTADVYTMRFDDGVAYWRRQLFRDGMPWRYVGVLHEVAVCDEPFTEARLEGDYRVCSRRLGARNRDPLKYARDAEILLAEVNRNPDDRRSVFYLAQSYRDAGDAAQARRWYERRAEMGGWDEEVYCSLFQAAQARERLGEPWPDVQEAYLRAWEHRPTRAEPLHAIARRCRVDGRYRLGHLFASRAAGIPPPSADMLFVSADVYAWRVLDELAVCASWLGQWRETFDLCARLLACADIPAEDRTRIAANQDLAVPHLQGADAATTRGYL